MRHPRIGGGRGELVEGEVWGWPVEVDAAFDVGVVADDANLTGDVADLDDGLAYGNLAADVAADVYLAQELVGDVVGGCGGGGGVGLMVGFVLEQSLDGVGGGVGVYDFVVVAAEEEEVFKGVAVGVGLGGVVAGATGAAGADVADFAGDGFAGDERTVAAGEGAAVAGGGEEAFDGLGGWLLGHWVLSFPEGAGTAPLRVCGGQPRGLPLRWAHAVSAFWSRRSGCRLQCGHGRR